LRSFDFTQRFDATELRADFGCRGNPAFGDDRDPGFGGDPSLPRRNFVKAGQGDVAADPAGAARRVWIDFPDVSNEIIN